MTVAPATTATSNTPVRFPSQAALPEDDRGTVLDLLLRNAREFGDVTAIVDGETRLTWAEFVHRARAMALALRDLGVQKGDVVGLHMINRAEHVVADAGALLAGATPTSFYYTLAPEQLAHVAGDSAARVVVIDPSLAPMWEQVSGDLSDLEHVVVVDDPAPPAGMLRFDDLLHESLAALPDREAEIDEVVETITPDDPLTIIYTSGTTGPPKGTVITHRGIRFTTAQGAGILARASDDLTGARYDAYRVNGRLSLPIGMALLSYLPLAHVAERFASYYWSMLFVSTVTYVRDLTQLAEVLPQVRPESFVAVPRVWEKLHAGIVGKLEAEANDRKRALGTKALEVAHAAGTAELDGHAPDIVTRLLHGLFDRLVYRRIREGIGLDRCLLAWSGAAPISTDLLATFTGMGITIAEVYGMTESSVLISMTPPGSPRPGTVGVPIPGMELRIAEDGEILVRGPNVTPGYLNRPDATAEAIDDDGWLHTGDLGSLDEAGYLSIVGRKKELIINAAGKNLSPNAIEETIKSASPLVGQVLAHGDGKPYIVALVVLDPDATPAWCAAHDVPFESLEQAAAEPAVREEVARAVEAGNQRLARVEQVKRWTLLGAEWTPQTDELTPTMKLKRRVIHDRYADQLESLYA